MQVHPTRSSPRVPLKLRVDWWVVGSMCHFVSSTEDLSRRGMFIASLTPMSVGTRLRMRIPVQSGEAGSPIELEGTVVHRGERGMGVSIDRAA